ncbi:glycerate kinase [Gryllotalpicola protaetiae]|uniref:Glycerate kinase n=1 Tax=Gryllotalpicola protaetiae TaxID=2419771 RepID=A0A387BJQ2_9MICO|nr:glycerate kinase [Gryllotalpicola protaetiae]AYG04073.1 glycerate kinase [Gryllotalpicola protaetiae]
MRLVIAPDSFKGSLTAREAAEAIRDGWLAVRPSDQVVLAPMADGGEGSLDAFEAAVPGARREPVMAVGPDDQPVLTYWLRLPPTPGLPGGTGVVELAATSGLTLMRSGLRPFEAHTFGLGQAIAAALTLGVSRLLIAVGGSASSDGGVGALTAMGARLTDASGAPVSYGNLGAGRVARVSFDGVVAPPPAGAVVLTDVDNPLLGPRGAAVVFGPQKGASSDAAMRALEGNLAHLAAVVDGGAALAETPGAGAAGGVAFGLLAWGATLSPGAPAVAEALGLAGIVTGADLVITGEGRFDGQSEAGKAPTQVASIARAAGVPTALVAGAIQASVARFSAAASLSELAGSTAAALAEPARWAREAGATLARSV